MEASLHTLGYFEVGQRVLLLVPHPLAAKLLLHLLFYVEENLLLNSPQPIKD